MEKIAPLSFYTEWKGHPISDLEKLYTNILLIHGEEKPIIWLAGDSSLDNKAWVPADGPGGTPLPISVPSIYTSVLKSLSPMKPDIAFWMNHFLEDKTVVINCAVEASLLRERRHGLLRHDAFVRDNIRPQDILVVSVGANDIVLSPTPVTVFQMMRLAYLSSQSSIENGTAWPLGYFRNMFGNKVKKYISCLISETKPAAVVVCMIYFPLEGGLSNQKGWADAQLKALKYDSQPAKLQAAIRTMYEQATKKIDVEGTKVIPLPFFEMMDGKKEEDYADRVEPSTEGGRKMSELLRDAILPLLDEVPKSRPVPQQNVNGHAT